MIIISIYLQQVYYFIYAFEGFRFGEYVIPINESKNSLVDNLDIFILIPFPELLILRSNFLYGQLEP